MAYEIERKFLVNQSLWRPTTRGIEIVQGYISTEKERVVRVRIKDDAAFLTIKGITTGISRLEFEYQIPPADARTMLSELCVKPPLRKIRHEETYGNHTFEIDVFEGDNAGLIIAEIELTSEKERFGRPQWLNEDISHDFRYSNASLMLHPFSSW